jgi:hypothetical protein
MYKFASYFLPVALLAVTILFWNCKEASPTEGDKNNNRIIDTTQAPGAYEELENQMYVMTTSSFHSTSDLDNINFTTANSLYKQSVAADPSSATANFGAGITEIYMIYADTVIKNAIKRWENSSLETNSPSLFFQFKIPSGTQDMSVPTQALAQNLAKIIQTAVVDPPLIGEMQDIMRDQLLPHINYTLARFEVVELNPNFEFTISGKMQGDIHQAPVYLDNTEVYIMDGVLRGLKALVEQFLVYRFELSAYNSQALVQALQPSNTSFFYLAPDGVARSQSVLADINGAVDKFQSAINYLKSETDNQSDDIIKIGHDGIHANDLDTALVYLAKAKQALSTTQSIVLYDADIDGNNYTIQVNVANLYNNPPVNPKTAWLPAYTVDTASNGDIAWHWTGQDYNSFNFPDPTFSGLFPGMTNTNLKRILHIDEAFSWKVYVWMYDYTNSLPASASAKLIINNTTYNPKRSYSYYYSQELVFYIMDNDNQPVQLVAVLDGGDVPLELSRTVNVKLKSYFDIDANLASAPDNITGYKSQNYVYLNLVNYPSGMYRIEKDSTNSSFSVIDSTSYSYYYDYKIASGKDYRYRARLVPYSYDYYYFDFAYAYKANNYTNIVTVSIP